MLTLNDLVTLSTATSASSAAQDTTHMMQWDATVVITDTTPAAKTYASGVKEVDKITFAAKAGTTDGDYFIVNDYSGGSWAVALDTTGTAANTPTGAAWVAVAAGNKVYTDISSATSGTDVAALIQTAINALSGFTAVITAVASSADLNCTDVWAGVVTAPTKYSKAGSSGTGSVTVAITTTGTVSAVATTGNTVTITTHGFATGLKVLQTTTGTLPTGLSASAEYVIVVDANTVKFATSQANALAGTAIAITGSGVGTQTVTPQALAGTLVVQKTNIMPNPGNTQSWFTITTPTAAATQNVSATTLNYYDIASGYPYMRFLLTVTSGSCSSAITLNGKGQ